MTLPIEMRDFAKRFVDDDPQILDAPKPPPEPRDLSPEQAWRMNEAAEEGRRKLTKVELLEVRRAYNPTDPTKTSKADLIKDIAATPTDEKMDPRLAKWIQSLNEGK